jgi:hypothetical protein
VAKIVAKLINLKKVFPRSQILRVRSVKKIIYSEHAIFEGKLKYIDNL